MHRRAWILMGVLAALWGASYLFIKVSLDDLDPVVIVFGRTALGAIVLVAVALQQGALSAMRGRWVPLTVLALVQVVAPFLLITIGEKHIASSLAGILVSSAPIFTALLAIRFAESERSRGWSAVGIVVGILGVGLLFGVDLSTDTAALLGGLAVLLASLGYAVGALYLKARLSDVPSVATAAGTMIVSATVLVPLLPFTWPDHAPGGDTIASMLALGAGGTGIAFLIFYMLINDVGPARASIVAYIAPGFSVIYGAAILDEEIGVTTLLGLALILAGSYLGAEGRLPWRRRELAEPDLAVRASASLGPLDEVEALRGRPEEALNES